LPVEFVARTLPVRRKTDQAGIDKHLEVLRNGRLRQIESLHDISTTAGLRCRQMPQDQQPRRMGERGKPAGYAAFVKLGDFAYSAMFHRASAIYDGTDLRKAAPEIFPCTTGPTPERPGRPRRPGLLARPALTCRAPGRPAL